MEIKTATTEYVGDNSFNKSYWFCIQTHPKHEHIAARCLTKNGGVEIFNPQLRTRKITKRGSVWFTESAFPSYIFSRFNLQTQLDLVRYSSGVTRVVHFKSGYPSVPDFQVSELQAVFGESSLLISPLHLAAGDTVRIMSGAFNNLLAVVQSVQPAKQRVLALLDFLGRMTAVDLDMHNLMPEECCRAEHHPLYKLKYLAIQAGSQKFYGDRQQ